jgi:hypothetical protein
MPCWTVRLLFAASLLFTMSLSAPAGAAGPRNGAKAHVEEGARKYRAERYADALAAFEEAYALDPAAVLLFNIAQCYRQLGDDERALARYRQYLEEMPDARNAADVRVRIRELEQTLAKQREHTPAPQPEPRTPSVAQPPKVAVATPVEQPAPSVSTSPANGSPPAGSVGSWRRPAAWATAGGALLAVGAGVAWQIAGASKLGDFDQSCGRDASGQPVHDPSAGGGTTDAACRGLFDDWERDRRLAIVGFVVGGAFAVTSAILFYTSSTDGSRASGPAHIACAPGWPGGLTCKMVF